MIGRILKVVGLALALAAAGRASAVTVLPDGSLTDLGLFPAGTYQITGAGLVDLVGDNNFLAMTIRPDGIPNTPVLRKH
jgi:hypothetical protein